MHRLRVLEICTEDPIRILGGMGMHVRKLVPRLREYCDVSLLTTCSESDEFFSSFYYDEFSFETRATLIQSIEYQQLEAAIALHLKRPFDLIHCHDWSAVRVGFSLRRMFGLPVVSTFHLFQRQAVECESLEVDEGVQYSLVREAQGLLRSDEVIVCSGAMVHYINEKMGIPRQPVLIRNGVSLEDLTWNGERTVELKNTKPIVLFAARVAEQKGVDVLLDAVELTDEFLFVFMGHLQESAEGLEEHRLQRRLRETEERYPDRMQLIGFRDGPEKAEMFNRAAYVVVPSLCEPFGITALEALAAGTPLVHSGVDGLGEFCTTENSIRCELSGEGIVRALTDDRDLGILVRNGKETARSLPWKAVAANTYRVMENVVKHREDCALSN